MINFEKIDGFDWDSGNIEKNLVKHGISCQEAEEIFLDINAIHLEDNKHSVKEQRFARIGKSFSGKILIAFFTIRKNKIRIISVRNVNKKENNLYLG
jgi:hypothetical protein